MIEEEEEMIEEESGVINGIIDKLLAFDDNYGFDPNVEMLKELVIPEIEKFVKQKKFYNLSTILILSIVEESELKETPYYQEFIDKLIEFKPDDAYLFFDENDVGNEFNVYGSKENTVVVRNLKSTTDSKTLAYEMGSFGYVTNARSITEWNGDDSYSNSFGFVTFKYEEGAMYSLKAKTFKIDDRIVLILPSPLNDVEEEEEDDRTLSVSQDEIEKIVLVQNLNYETETRTLAEAFFAFGKVTEARIVTRRVRGTIRSRGFGFVQFATKEEAAKAIDCRTIYIEDRRVRISQAKRKNREPRVVAFLGGVVENTTEEQIKVCFPTAKAITIHPPKEGRKGFAFVTFETEEALVSAIKDVREVNINGAKVIVQVANPKISSRRNF